MQTSQFMLLSANVGEHYTIPTMATVGGKDLKIALISHQIGDACDIAWAQLLNSWKFKG